MLPIHYITQSRFGSVELYDKPEVQRYAVKYQHTQANITRETLFMTYASLAEAKAVYFEYEAKLEELGTCTH